MTEHVIHGLVFGLVGIAVGMAVNLLADRLPGGKGLLGFPECHRCGARLGVLSLSGLAATMLRRRCLACASGPLRRSWVVEFGLALVFAAFGLKWSLGWQLGFSLFFVAVMALLFVTDLEHRRILNTVVAGAAIIALAGGPASGNIVSAVIGGLVGFGVMLVVFVISRGGFGAGDVKLAGLIGLIFGWPAVVSALAAGIMLGGVAAGLLLVFGIVGRKSMLPYGPFLAIGAIVGLFVGPGDWFPGAIWP